MSPGLGVSWSARVLFHACHAAAAAASGDLHDLERDSGEEIVDVSFCLECGQYQVTWREKEGSPRGTANFHMSNS
jgi:hypothetical protein